MKLISALILGLAIMISSGQAQPFVPDASTFGLWHFDESPGTFVAFDASGNGYNMALQNGAQFSGSAGYYDGGVDLTDPDARVASIWTVGNGWTSLTIDAYIYAAQINNDEHPIVCRTDFWNIDEVSYYFHVRENGSIAGGVWMNEVGTQNAEAISSPNVIQTGQWYRVAMTWSSGQPVRIFVDDMSTPLVTGTESPEGYIRISDDPLSIGCNWYQIYGWFYWQGYLDEVRISNVDRYPAISYPGEFIVDDHTAALWHFNENAGTIAHDATEHNYDMALQDGAGWHAPGWNNTPSSVDLTDPDAKVNSNYLIGNGWDELTIDAHVKLTMFNADENPVVERYQFYASNPAYYLTILPNGAIYAGVYQTNGGYTSLTTNAVINLNTWYYIQMTWSSGGQLKIFVNESPVDSVPSEVGAIRNSTHPLTIGWFHDTGYGDFHMNGYIDEVRISDIDRSEPPGGPVQIALTPINPPIIIPQNGGSFSFDANLANVSGASQTFDVWGTIEVPGGAQFIAFNPVTVTFNPGMAISRLRTQAVPGSAPGGTYFYRGFVGDYPWHVEDADGFEFTKLGADGVWHGSDGWICSGEPFPGEIAATDPAPERFALKGGFPNPFNAATVLSFELRAASRVNLAVYDISGRLVATLVDGWREAGVHEIIFDGSSLSSGIYFYRITAEGWSETEKMVLLR